MKSRILFFATFATVTFLVGAAAFFFSQNRGDVGRGVNIKGVPKVVPRAESHASTPAVAWTSVPEQRKKVVASYESAKDVWEFANAALGSKNSGALFEAYTGTQECLGLVNNPLLQNFASGSPAVPEMGELTPERQQAIQVLVKKCLGFFQAGLPAGRLLREKLLGQGKEIGGPEFRDFPINVSREEMLQNFVQLQSPTARVAASYHLDSVIDPLIDGEMSPEARENVRIMVALLAMCQLGRDCSTKGSPYLVQCAWSGKCGDSLWSDWEKQPQLSNESVEIINHVTAKFLKVVKEQQ